MSTDCKEESMNGDGQLPEYDDRDIILHKLNDAIDYIHNKAMNGRILNEKNEKVRISWFKALAYSCSIYNQIKRDTEIDQLKEEMETLKYQIKIMDNNPKEKEINERDDSL